MKTNQRSVKSAKLKLSDNCYSLLNTNRCWIVLKRKQKQNGLFLSVAPNLPRHELKIQAERLTIAYLGIRALGS